MDYKAELDEAIRRNKTYKYNMYKLYALFWEIFSKAMQNKIGSRLDYDSSVYNNPIALLQAIRQHSSNYQETRYKMVFVLVILRSTLTSRQNDGEGLQDYTRQFNISTEILEYHLGGPLILEIYFKTMELYD